MTIVLIQYLYVSNKKHRTRISTIIQVHIETYKFNNTPCHKRPLQDTTPNAPCTTRERLQDYWGARSQVDPYWSWKGSVFLLRGGSSVLRLRLWYECVIT